MIEYIYFVKCPDCEDEHFDFFDEAKEFALSCLSQRPIITQVEVNRNDFGECIDRCDLGTVWSWEDMMTDDEPTVSVFTKDDLECMNRTGKPCCDAEFDDLDNSVDFEPEISEVSAIDDIPDNFRKPIPEGMTLKELVEEMEENEDEVECTWCEELFDKDQCRYEVNLGWLCSRCEAAIKSRGETLTFREGSYWDFLDEAVVADSTVVGKFVCLTYKDSKYHTDGEPYQLRDLKSLLKSSDLAELDTTGINLIVKFDNKCKVLQETDKAYLVTIPCYYRNQIDRSKIEERPKYVRCWIPKQQAELLESTCATNFLEELEEAADYRKRLTPCPECGAEQTFDRETGFCLECGFN